MKIVIDRIKDRVLPSEFIAKYVFLKKKGHEYQGLCPFHQEKTPSFTVNDDKGFFHCFGCHAHGGVIDFLMKIEGIEFKEAVSKIGQMYGIDVRISDQAKKQENDISKIESVLETAKNWFIKEFRNSISAQNYCNNRQLSNEIVSKYEIGYAPGKYSDLLPYLRKIGFDDEIIIKSGLAWRSEDGKVLDSFVDRLMIPIYNIKGKVIAFGGRTLDSNNKNIAKYKNSHESLIFKKRETVFNLQRVKQNNLKNVIITEGYMDVIAFSKIGIDHAVAPLGTALTPEQMRLIWRFDKEPIFCFDGDAAGINGMYKAFIGSIAKYLTVDNGIKFIILPENKDPDDVIKNDPKKMADILASPMSMIDFIWHYHFEMSGLPKNPENLAKIDNEIQKTVSFIGDGARRDHFKQFLKSRIRSENFKLSRLNISWKSDNAVAPFTVSAPKIIDNKTRFVAHMMYIIFKYHEYLEYPEFDIHALLVDPSIRNITDVEELKNEPYKIIIPESIDSTNASKYFNYYYKLYQLEVLNDNLKLHYENVGMGDQKKSSLLKAEILLCRQELELLKNEIFV